MNDGHATRLDAAVIAIDRFVPADRRVGKTLGFLLVGEQFDILAQPALVALQRQDVVGLLVDDLARNLALASHRVDGDDRPIDRQHVEKRRNGDNLVRLLAHPGLRQHQPLSPGEGRDHVDGRRKGRVQLFHRRAPPTKSADIDKFSTSPLCHALPSPDCPGAMVDLYCESFATVPKRITLDIDDTFDAVHGGQQLRLFNAHYDE